MASFIRARFPLFSLCAEFLSIIFLKWKRKTALLLLYSSILFSRLSALPRQKEKKKRRHNMHLCIPAHTIPIHFHHKSPQPGGNIQSICGPHMRANSGLIYLCSGVQMEVGGKNNTNDIKCVCELIRESSRPLYKACESLFSTAAFHRWRWWLHFIPDDDCNEAGFEFHWAFLEMQRDWQKLDTLDSQMLSGHFAPCPLQTPPLEIIPRPEWRLNKGKAVGWMHHGSCHDER